MNHSLHNSSIFWSVGKVIVYRRYRIIIWWRVSSQKVCLQWCHKSSATFSGMMNLSVLAAVSWYECQILGALVEPFYRKWAVATLIFYHFVDICFRLCHAKKKFRRVDQMMQDLKIENMSEWKFTMVTREPADRFLSGFIDRCIRLVAFVVDTVRWIIHLDLTYLGMMYDLHLLPNIVSTLTEILVLMAHLDILIFSVNLLEGQQTSTTLQACVSILLCIWYVSFVWHFLLLKSRVIITSAICSKPLRDTRYLDLPTS